MGKIGRVTAILPGRIFSLYKFVFKQTEADKFLVRLHRDQNVYVVSTCRTQLSPDRLSRDSDVIQITEDDATNL